MASTQDIGGTTGAAISELEDWANECEDIARECSRVASGEEDDSGYTSKAAEIRETIQSLRDGPITHDDGNDYVWNGEPCWLTYEGNSIQIHFVNGDLRVEVFPKGEEMQDPISTADLTIIEEEG